MGAGRSGLPKGVKRGDYNLKGYKVFTSVPAYSHEYESDDGQTARWFKKNSNIDDVISGMSYFDIDAINDYWSPGHFMSGQQYDGFSSMSATDQELTRSLDKSIDKSEFNKGIVAVRLSSWNQLGGKKSDEQLNKLIGSETVILGHQSAAAAKEGLKIAGGKSVEYRFHIPAGVKGAAMWIGDKRINGWGDKQREILINRDHVYTFAGYHYDAARGVTVIDLVWNRALKHNYD